MIWVARVMYLNFSMRYLILSALWSRIAILVPEINIHLRSRLIHRFSIGVFSLCNAHLTFCKFCARLLARFDFYFRFHNLPPVTIPSAVQLASTFITKSRKDSLVPSCDARTCTICLSIALFSRRSRNASSSLFNEWPYDVPGQGVCELDIPFLRIIEIAIL